MKQEFFKENFMSIISMIGSILACVFTLGYQSNKFTGNTNSLNEKIANIQAQIVRVDQIGSAAYQQTKWIVEIHSKDILELKAEARVMSAAVTEMRSDIRMVADWVKKQQNRQDLNKAF